MSPRPAANRFLIAALSAAILGVVSCGPSEEEIKLGELQEDLMLANTTIDSLNYTVESTNILIDEMRSRVDSLNRADAKLVQSIQRLNSEVKKWQNVAGEQRRKNQQLTAEIERMKREKQTDQRAIARLRSEADSLNTELLEVLTSARRQEDHVRRVEVELGRTRDDLAQLREAGMAVRVYAATEGFLRETGYLEASRGLTRGFRKSYKLVQKLDPTDSRVQLVPIGEALVLEGKLKALVDRYGKLSSGDDYRTKKQGGSVEITFLDEMLEGVDILAVMED